MVAPISPLIIQTDYDVPRRRRTRRYHRQGKPYNLPLWYDLSDFIIDSSVSSGGRVGNDYTVNNWLVTPQEYYTAVDRSYAKAYDQFVDNLRETQASMAVTLAERQQAVATIEKRCVQLARAYRQVRKCRFGDAARTLGMTHPPDKRGLKARAKDAGSNWLEFWLGWSPLIGDIGNAVEVLQGTVPVFRALGRATVGSAYSLNEGSPLYGYSSVGSIDTTAKSSISAYVKVTNPNLDLANQLGFVNPALVLWELVPFSFVLDWFVNVSSFLGSFTDLWGLGLINPYVTTYTVQKHRQTQRWNYGTDSPYNGSQSGTGTVIHVHRRPGPPQGPKLVIRAPWRLSVTRALTSVGLLLQQMR